MKHSGLLSFRLFLPMLMILIYVTDAVTVVLPGRRLPPFGNFKSSPNSDSTEGLNAKLLPIQPFGDRVASSKGNTAQTPAAGTSITVVSIAKNVTMNQTPNSTNQTSTQSDSSSKAAKFARFSTRIKRPEDEAEDEAPSAKLGDSTSGNATNVNSTAAKPTPKLSAATGKSTNPTAPKTTAKPRVRRIRVFQLANVSFPADSEVKLSSDFYPGVQSGNVVVPVPNVSKPSSLKLLMPNSTAEIAKGQACTSRGERAKGFCFALADVIAGRSCSNLTTVIANECSQNEVCCFSPNSNRPAAEAYDKAPCGIRRPVNATSRSFDEAESENDREVDLEAEGRIINGVLAEEGEICWQAAVMVDSAYACGGAIISSGLVITAAHCVQDVDTVKRLRVRLGHQNVKVRKRCSESFEVSQVIFHDLYDPSTFAFDLAILKLSAPITNVNCSCRACLPDISKDKIKSEDCIVSGYGTTQPDSSSTTDSGILNVGQVSVVNNSSECSQRFRKAPEVDLAFNLDSSMLCAIGSDTKKLTDTCDLDSGSPLACTLQGGAANAYTLVGVSSWGLPCGTNDNTLHPQQAPIPSVYSDVIKSIDWIREAISNSTSVL